MYKCKSNVAPRRAAGERKKKKEEDFKKTNFDIIFCLLRRLLNVVDIYRILASLFMSTTYVYRRTHGGDM